MRANVLATLVVRITSKPACVVGKLIEVLLEAVLLSRGLRIVPLAFGALPLISALSGNLFSLADSVYNLFHRLDIDGSHPSLASLPKEFGHTMLDVVGNLFPTLLAAKIALHTLEIALQQVVGILVYII